MTCDEAAAALAAAALGERDPAALARARAHAARCPRCADVERADAEDAALLAVAVEPLAPPARLRRRIVAAVWRDWERRGAARRSPTRMPSLRLGVAGVAAATLVLAGAGAGAWLRAAAPSPRVAAIRATLSAPSVSGTVSYDPASRTLVVAVRGLGREPRTASGSAATYALWLVRANNAVLAAGALQADPDGSWRAALPPPPNGFVALAATLEVAPAGAAPTGPQLFQAILPTG